MENIFLRKNVLIVFLFFCLLFIVFFYICFLFFVVLFWLFYFYSCYFFYRLFKYKKCQTLDLRLYNYITEKYTSNLKLGNFFVFFKNFFFYQPKLLAFKYYYNSIKIYHEKKEINIFLFMFFIIFLLLVLPFRFFIKWLTGFSYFSIKVSSICTNKMFIVLDSDWDFSNFYSDVIEMYLQLISSHFFTGLFVEIIEKKIYFNYDGVDIYCNPPQTPRTGQISYKKYINNPIYLQQAIKEGVMNIQPAVVTVKSVDNSKKDYNGAVINNRNNAKIVYLESDQKEHIVYKDGTSHPILLQSHEGLFGKKHVNSYIAATTKKQEDFKEVVINHKLKHYNQGELHTLEKDKFLVYRAMLLSLFEPNTVITDTGVINDSSYNNFWDKLQDMYDKKELHPSLTASFEYCSYFLKSNNLKPMDFGPKKNSMIAAIKEDLKLKESCDDHKVILIKDMITNTDIKNGEILLPDYIKEPSFEIRESIKYFDENNWS